MRIPKERKNRNNLELTVFIKRGVLRAAVVMTEVAFNSSTRRALWRQEKMKDLTDKLNIGRLVLKKTVFLRGRVC